MTKITPENITQTEIIELLEVLIFHQKILGKIQPSTIGFGKIAIFQKYVRKIDDLYFRLDNK